MGPSVALVCSVIRDVCAVQATEIAALFPIHWVSVTPSCSHPVLMSNHRITGKTECLKLEGTHEDHRIPLPIPPNLKKKGIL